MSEVKVKQVMTRRVVTLSPEETILEATAKLLDKGISGAPVVENDEVIGMVSEADIIHSVVPAFPKSRRSILELLMNTRSRKLFPPAWGPRVRDIMNSFVVSQISPDASIWEAVSLMERKGVKRLPVIDAGGRLVGIVSRADVIRAMGRPDSAIRSDLIETLQILGPETFEDLEVTVDQGIATLRGESDARAPRGSPPSLPAGFPA